MKQACPKQAASDPSKSLYWLSAHSVTKANTSHIVKSNTIIFSIAYSTSVTANKTHIICATNLLYCLYKGWSRLRFLKALSILTGKPAMDNDFQNPFLLPFLYHISLTNLFKNQLHIFTTNTRKYLVCVVLKHTNLVHVFVIKRSNRHFIFVT